MLFIVALIAGIILGNGLADLADFVEKKANK
jgi:hypothetical protein